MDPDTSPLPSSSRTLSDLSRIKEKKMCKNHVLHKKSKSCYYVCLGVLMHTMHKQIQNKYAQNDNLYLKGCKYINDLYEWVYQFKYDQKSMNEFFKPLIASVALFAVGIKLTNELAAWKLF